MKWNFLRLLEKTKIQEKQHTAFVSKVCLLLGHNSRNFQSALGSAEKDNEQSENGEEKKNRSKCFSEQ